jgi:hypothetical protein
MPTKTSCFIGITGSQVARKQCAKLSKTEIVICRMKCDMQTWLPDYTSKVARAIARLKTNLIFKHISNIKCQIVAYHETA